MDWFRLNSGLPQHPKVGRLARRLSVNRDRALLIVVRLLCWTASAQESGEITGADDEDIAEACGWEGDPMRFVCALEAAGWLDRADERVEVHGWKEWQEPIFRHRERSARSRQKRRDDTVSTPCGYRQTDRQTSTSPNPSSAEEGNPARSGRRRKHKTPAEFDEWGRCIRCGGHGNGPDNAPCPVCLGVGRKETA